MSEETQLIPRTTIEQVVHYRNQALELYAEAYVALEAADTAVKAAQKMASRAHPGINGYNYHMDDERKAFAHAIQLPPRDRYLRTAKKLIDCDCWAWIIERTDLERLMDKQAKDQLREQMQYVPDKVDGNGQLITGEEAIKSLPEITVDTVYATLQTFAADAGTIFKRGIANAFSALDRRFKSHDGFKVGGRMILPYAFDEHGIRWNSRHQDTLLDVERTFLVLDGRGVASYGGLLHRLREKIGWRTPRPVVIESDYMRVRVFKNGNAHLWFTRPDLVEKVNAILAEWYGEVIADGQTAKEDPLDKIKNTPAKFYGFYPTPDGAADHLMHGVGLHLDDDGTVPRVLEPSAGTGNLARRLAAERESWARNPADRVSFRPLVDCVEIQPHHARALDAAGIYNRVFCGDFLQLKPTQTGLYDVVVMNPPFDLERDIDHVNHALAFLKPSGTLHAIMSAGTEFRETRKSKAFRALIERMNGRFTDLPAGSFAEQGTNVNTVILRVHKNGRKFY